AIPHTFQSPTKVDFFHMREEIVIEPTGSFPCGGFDKQCGSRCPKNFHGCVILAVIFFYIVEYTATAKRIAIFIDETTGCTCVFKFVFLVIGQYFWLCC